MFEKMDTAKTKYDKSVMCLTSQTSNAASVTVNGMIVLIKFLLSKGMRYVCTREFNSDRIEKEFSKWRQSCGGNTTCPLKRQLMD